MGQGSTSSPRASPLFSNSILKKRRRTDGFLCQSLFWRDQSLIEELADSGLNCTVYCIVACLAKTVSLHENITRNAMALKISFKAKS